jgi:hypothetical protein
MRLIEEFKSKLDSLVDAELSSLWGHNKHRTLSAQIKNLVTEFYTENTSFLDPTAIDQLSKSEDFSDRLLVAQHSKTLLPTLVSLSVDSSPSIRTYVALNLNATSELLDTMSYDESYVVRTSVAQNKNTNIETLLRLACDSSYYVRYQVVINPSTTKSILNLLTNDENKTIRELVTRGL